MTLPGIYISILPVRPVEMRFALRWYEYRSGTLSVSSCLCADDFLEVFVEAVRVGDGHSVDGLFPSGDFPAFDKAAG